jgi:hypothetical protein
MRKIVVDGDLLPYILQNINVLIKRLLILELTL